MGWSFEETRAGYSNMWRSATIKPSDSAQADKFANLILKNEARYKRVEALTNVPWFLIGGWHMRESSNNFEGVLHNGGHIIGTGRKTSLVPAGRGPFATWEDAAVDALRLKGFDTIKVWPVERMLWASEIYNGIGYVGKGVNSPYVWAGTSH